MTTRDQASLEPDPNMGDVHQPPAVRAEDREAALEALGLDLAPDLPDTVFPDEYESDEYGVTLIAPGAEVSATRVAWLNTVTPEVLPDLTRAFHDEFPDIDLTVHEMMVGPYRGVVISGVPGMDETTVTLLDAGGRVIKITTTGTDRSAADDRAMIAHGLRSPRRSLPKLPRMREMLGFDPNDYPPVFEPKSISGPDELSSISRGMMDIALVPAGCTSWSHSKSLQTPIDSSANGNGRTVAGPSFFGEGFHTRCDAPSRLNDHFAIDFPLRQDDSVLAPATGQVLWTGWASGGWATLGRVVIVDHGQGFWSLSAHLHKINVSAGSAVTLSTILGLAGGSGQGRDNYFGNHLHQGLYLNARLSSANGGIYGGQSARPVNIRFVSRGGGTIAEYTKGQVVSW